MDTPEPKPEQKPSLLPNVLLGLVTLLLLGTVMITAGQGCDTPDHRADTDFVGLLHVEGIISSGGGGGGMFSEPSAGSDYIQSLLDDAAGNPRLKALLIRINSPGGSAPASEEIYHAIQRFKKETGVPVVVSMADVAASGGYYIAASADKIYANRSTFTGSIGVILPLLQYHGLFDKIGLSASEIISGKYKDIGSPTRPMTPEEKHMLQTMTDQVHQQFIDAVAEGRKTALSRDALLKVADGRILTGEQAHKAKLVDEIGTFHDATQAAGKLAGLGADPVVISLEGHMSLFEELFGQVRGPNPMDALSHLPRDPLSRATATLLMAQLPGTPPQP